ncbi:alanine racemase [Flavonifractor sp. An306]|uniref:alanine racemase n=1 Tax=Flavonifractor sp. An306 TaxID=1965629 RepID=UPI001FA8754A|nr:alanine/ornithine racemase family PLP-dependent enzyme [Flavonifractor sp. An306]
MEGEERVMYAPVLEIDTQKVTQNAEILRKLCDRRGVELAFVTKGFSARPEVIRAAMEGGITCFADSRMKNIISAKRAIPGLKYLLIRIPAPDEAEEVVRWADWSLQSQIEVIRAVSEAALRQGKVHPIILMIDVGDLREGVFGREQLDEIAPQIKACPGVELVGLGTNVGCYGSILPSVENTQILVELRDYLNETYGFCITTLSGGSTCTLGLLEAGTLPAGINQLRVGEGVLFGEDTTGSRFLEGCHHDAFTFRAQVVELRRKPSVPIGEHGRDGKGDTPEYPDRGVRLRAICAAGKQDVAWAALTPTLPGAWMIGASSDHLIVDVEDCGGQVRVGDWMEFRCGYMAVLDATTSAYVDIVVK